MSVDRSEVARIAELARLRLDDDEVDRLTGDMNSILAYADRLRGIVAEQDAAERGMGGDAPGPTERGGAGERAGGRDGNARDPDSLREGPGSFAPRFEQQFFVVPPPPGVTG